MIPEHYFRVICCPKCKSDLEADGEKEQLLCPNCQSTYPIVEGIPILLPEVRDKVSQIIKQFYDSEWQRDKYGILRAKVLHEDLSDLGQLYIQVNENRFLNVLRPARDRDFFLDVGSGAQPRTEFGQTYTFHICLDLSLSGLLESRNVLGNRAICVCGSLLDMPLKDSICNGIIASHVLYHIDKDRQGDAIRQLSRALRPGGTLLIFYANPNSFEQSMVNGLKKLIGKKAVIENSNGQLYYYVHPIEYILSVLYSDFGEAKVDVEPLRMFTRRITQYPFKSRFLGKIMFKMIVLVEGILGGRPDSASYVAYIAEKPQMKAG